MGKKVKHISKELQDTLAASTSLAQEKISNIRTVRSFAMETREVRAYQDQMGKVLEKAERDAMTQAKFYGVTGMAGNMIVLTVLYYGGSLVTNDVLTVGNLASFVLYSAYVGIGLSGVSTFYGEMMKGLGASTRLWELTDRTPLIPPMGGIVPVNPKGQIRFENVSFAYPTRPDQDILKSLNLDIPPKTVVAIVGPSGSGKSTIGSLLLRLYSPNSGSVSLDGQEIGSLDPNFLRTYIGTVSQEPVLFSSSIRDNILYGAPNPEKVSQEDLERAAKEANAHNFIMAFPEGYDTLVGERGVMLSGGQKQRVAIARAILKNSPILIFDEATSSLDSITEQSIMRALGEATRGRTSVIIAHRLSTVVNCDKILVMHRGQIAEMGTHSQLLSNPTSLYFELWNSQHNSVDNSTTNDILHKHGTGNVDGHDHSHDHDGGCGHAHH